MMKQAQADDPKIEIKKFAVAAETTLDPHCNYTILGRIVELDVTEFDSIQAAAAEAVDEAMETMPENKSDIVDNNFKVFVISGSVYVPIPEDSEEDSSC